MRTALKWKESFAEFRKIRTPIEETGRINSKRMLHTKKKKNVEKNQNKIETLRMFYLMFFFL